MTAATVPRWLAWAREFQAMGQTGLTYSLSDYDTERYTRLAAIAAEIVESHTGLPAGPAQENFLVQPGYATPKVDVRAAIVRDGRILLVQGQNLIATRPNVGQTPVAGIRLGKCAQIHDMLHLSCRAAA